MTQNVRLCLHYRNCPLPQRNIKHCLFFSKTASAKFAIY